jgi:hypothetical protein
MMASMRLLPALLVAFLLACSSGGDDLITWEEEPNDTPAEALDLGVLWRSVLAGGIEEVAPGPVAQGDLDYWRFRVEEHGRLTARLVLARGADYDLALFDARGSRQATSRSNNLDPDVGAVEMLYAALRAGETYFVEVGGFAGVAQDYRLDLSFTPERAPGPPDPDTALSVPADPLAVARSFHTVVRLPDGRVLISGGTSDPSGQPDAVLGALDSNEIFDPARNETVGAPQLGQERFGLVATVLPTGRVLLAAGDLAATGELYDPDRGEFVARDIPLVGPARFLPTATLLTDGRVLVAGGVTIVFDPMPSAQTLDSTVIFDPKTRGFSAGPMLQSPRVSHAAARVEDGRVLLTGGPGRDDSEWIDAAATTSLPGPDLTSVRDDHTATLLADGRVLLAGGQDQTGRSLNHAEVLEGGAFRRLTDSMRSRRADHQAMRLPGGEVLLFGGEFDPGDDDDLILASVEYFQPLFERFVAMPSMVVPRDDHRLARLADGRVLVTGGEDADSRSIADVEVYRPR